MGTADLSGVELALGGLLDRDEPSAERPEKPAAGRRTVTRETQKPARDEAEVKTVRATPERKEQPGAERHRTRTGRPLGRRAGETRLKRKTTISIDAELMDAYADRTWKEKCQLGELVERALRSFQDQNWGRNA